MNDQVAEYSGLVESLSAKLSPRARGNPLLGRDDLVQEGLINVWQTLMRGITPSAELIEKRLLNYIRWGNSRKNLPYETANPLEDYRGVLSRPEVSG
jgi:hypothetical protein